MTYYIFYGFNRLDYIDNSELAGFEHLLEEAREKVNNLLLSLQPVDTDVKMGILNGLPEQNPPKHIDKKTTL